MYIKRKSAISGIERTRSIPVNPDDYIAYKSGVVNMEESMPYLTDEDRDFIISGIIPEEWEKIFETVTEDA
jgi:hypothetical protein